MGRKVVDGGDGACPNVVGGSGDSSGGGGGGGEGEGVLCVRVCVCVCLFWRGRGGIVAATVEVLAMGKDACQILRV